MRILIQNGCILTLDAQSRVFECGDILIDGTKIVDLGSDLDVSKLNPDQIIDATNKLITPGLVNADLHAAEFLSKGMFENRPLELRNLHGDDSSCDNHLTSEMVYMTALLAGLQALKSGVTTVQDHWRFSPTFAREGTAAVFKAYRQIGLRANLALEIESNHLHRSPLITRETEETTESKVEKFINSFEDVLNNCQMADRDNLRIGISSPEELLVNDRFVKWLAEISESGNTAVHFHFNQTKCQVVNAKKIFQGQTAVKRAGETGLLTPRTSVSHAVWVTPAEIDLLALKRVSVIHTPLSDLYAGSGMVPLHLLLEAGVHIGLGSGESCGGNLNLFDVLKITASIHRIVQPDYHRWVSVEQALLMATRGGARACLLDKQIGQIAVGRKADLVLYDLKGFPFSPLNNPIDQLVCLENGSSVDTVIVDGNVVTENGRVNSVDETATLQLFRQQFQRSRGELENDNRMDVKLEASFEDAYRECASQPMQIRRWADNPVLESRLAQAFVKKDD
jgi:5-methylthioadenosine/S-adenosylhomocysteine deaminase